MKKRLLFLLTTLFALGAFSQKALPYEFGFESAPLSDGWIINCVSDETGLTINDYHTGETGFQFTFYETNGSLVSPLFTGGENGIAVSFWYREESNEYGDVHFQVGYTTDAAVSDASLFTYGDDIVASEDWQEYTNTFPAGTKRIAVKYIYDETDYLYLDDFTFKAVETVIQLAEDADIATLLSDNNGKTSMVELTGRTLYDNTRWNTLCLPFDVDLTADGPLKGATAKTLSNVTVDGSTVTITFKDAGTTLQAGKPYFVLTANNANLTSPKFKDATINSTTPTYVSVTGATFKGTYAPVTLTAGTKNVLYLQGNKLYWPETGDATVNPFRAYIQLDSEVAAAARSFVLNFDDEETATGIIEAGADSQLSVWYTLDGRQLQGKPTHKGIYVINGKKIIIK